MNATGTGTTEKIGIGGTVNGYAVLAIGDAVAVERDGVQIARTRVEGLGRFVAAARDLRLGWGRFPDDAEVIFLYDKGDGGFGYALNLACDWCSEWGYAPFAA
jgi:hypothetical protein